MAKSNSEGSVSRGVANFYDKHGWVDQGEGSSGEDQLFRRFPAGHDHYSHGVNQRVAALVGGHHETLLFVGCGDMQDNHVALAHGFSSVTCVDISEAALRIAERKLGPGAIYRRESIVECALSDNLFEVVYCAHVVYHIDKQEQEKAVKQMIRLVKPGGRVIIVYANPRSAFTVPGEVMRWIKRRTGRTDGAEPTLYYHAHPHHWWRRFAPMAALKFVPWEAIGSRPARALLRTDGMSRVFFQGAEWLETNAPSVAARLWQYPIVVLDKKPSAG